MSSTVNAAQQTTDESSKKKKNLSIFLLPAFDQTLLRVTSCSSHLLFKIQKSISNDPTEETLCVAFLGPQSFIDDFFQNLKIQIINDNLQGIISFLLLNLSILIGIYQEEYVMSSLQHIVRYF